MTMDRLCGCIQLGQHTVRWPAALYAWMRAYAAATSTTASWENVRDAATAGISNKPAKSLLRPSRRIPARAADAGALLQPAGSVTTREGSNPSPGTLASHREGRVLTGRGKFRP